MHRTTAAIAIAAAGALALPGAASAKTYKAFAGPPSVPESAPDGADLNRFFPATLKVRRGDAVSYTVAGFHTVSVLGKGEAFPPIAAPDPQGGTYSGINAPDGSPFFFNGLPKFIYNPGAFGPTGDLVVDDAETHSSGVLPPVGNKPQKAKLTFRRTGSFKVLCFIHPGMQQKVKVMKPKAKGADTSAKVKTAIARQVAGGFKDAAKAAALKPPEATVYAGTERKLATILAFLPGQLTVKAGTTVSFELKSPSEGHNMVFLGRQRPDGTFPADAFAQQHTAQTDLLPAGPNTPNQVAPGFVYGSEPAAGPGTFDYSGDEYGNGFLWTPLMDGLPGEPPNGLPSTERIKFSAPGTYGYYCAIHPFMRGSVTVQ